MRGLITMMFTLVLVACTNVQEQKLIGKWQATSLVEDDMAIGVPASEVGFEFFKNGFYNFRSTLSYREAGTFSVRGSLLYTLDTLNEASTEKSVQILELTQDSLFLKMNDEGKIRIVKLARQ